MSRLTYIIPPEADGDTVGRFLRYKQGVSSRTVKSLKHLPEGMMLNGAHIRTVDPLRAGDRLELNLPEARKRLPDCDTAVPVLYIDDDVMVYDKPSGMPVHQSGGHIFGTLASVYSTFCGDGDNVFRPVNRIDMDTTGAIVIARHQVAASSLWKKVSKRYVAVVEGVPSPSCRIIDLPLDREREMEIKRIVDPEGQRAVTEYRLLAAAPDGSCSLCGFILHTGRTHQIRVHMSYIGHPLLGDELYGGDMSAMHRQALHCAAVRFALPGTGEKLTVAAPLPPDISGLLDAKGVDWRSSLDSFIAELSSEDE